MTNLTMQLCGIVSDERGTFQTAIRESDLLVALRNAISGWEDEGGAGLSDERG